MANPRSVGALVIELENYDKFLDNLKKLDDVANTVDTSLQSLASGIKAIDAAFKKMSNVSAVTNEMLTFTESVTKIIGATSKSKTDKFVDSSNRIVKVLEKYSALRSAGFLRVTLEISTLFEALKKLPVVPKKAIDSANTLVTVLKSIDKAVAIIKSSSGPVVQKKVIKAFDLINDIIRKVNTIPSINRNASVNFATVKIVIEKMNQLPAIDKKVINNIKTFGELNKVVGAVEGVPDVGKALSKFARKFNKVNPENLKKAGDSVRYLSVFVTTLKNMFKLFKDIKLPNGTAIGALSGGYANQLLEFSTFLNTLADRVLPPIVRAIGKFKNIKNTTRLESIAKFLDELGTFMIRFVGLQGRIKRQALGDNAIEDLKKFFRGIGPVADIISKAVQKFNRIKNPESAKAAGAAINAIVNLLDTLIPLIKKIELGRGIFIPQSKITKYIRGIQPLARFIAIAMNEFSRVKRPENVSAVGLALKAITGIIKQLEEFYGQQAGIFRLIKPGRELTRFVRGIRPLTKILADAVSAFDKVKRPQNLSEVAGFFRGFSELIKNLEILRKDQPILRRFFVQRTELTKYLRGIKPFMKILAESLNKLDKIKNPQALAAIAPAFAGLAKLLNALASVEKSSLGKGIRKELGKAIKEILNAFVEASKKIKDADKLNKLATALDKLSSSLKRFGQLQGLGDTAKEIKEGLPQIIDAVNKGFKGGLGNEGEKQGKNFASSFIGTIKRLLGIASPSKVMRAIGEDVTRGFKFGLGSLTSLTQTGFDFAKSFVNGLKRGFDSIAGVLNTARTVITDTIKSMGQSITAAGRNLFQGGLATATAGGIFGFLQKEQVNVVSNFGAVLNQIRVFGGVAREELGAVEDFILDFSARTIFDPTQSVTAFLDLQKAGLSLTESFAALPEVGDLATAGILELEPATKIALAAIQTFQLGVESLGAVSDAYVRAANNSTASVQELGDGLANVGPIASEFGLSLEETLAVLALFNDRGIRGAEAGTQLRSMLNGLLRPTKEVEEQFASLGVTLTDSLGNLKPLEQIINDLNKSMNDVKVVTTIVTNTTSEQTAQLELAEQAYAQALRQISIYESGLSTGALGANADKQLEKYRQVAANAQGIIEDVTGSQEVTGRITREIQRSQLENIRTIQELAGTYGQQGLAILLSEGDDAISGFIEQMNLLPGANELANETMDTFKGTVESFKGSLQALYIEGLSPVLEDGLKPIIAFGVKVVNAIGKLPKKVLSAAAAFGILAASLTTLVGVGLTLAGAFLFVLGPAITAFGTALAFISGALLTPIAFIGQLIAVITILGAAFVGFIATASGVVLFGALLARAISDIKNNTDGAGEAFDRVKDKIGVLFSEISQTIGAFIEFVAAFAGAGDALARLGEDGEAAVGGIRGILDRVSSVLDDIIDKFKEVKLFFQFFAGVATGAIQGNEGSDYATAIEQNAELARLIAEREKLVRELSEEEKKASENSGEYTVRVNDTLYDLARQYDTTVDKIKELNNIQPGQFIQPGQVLKIPGAEGESSSSGSGFFNNLGSKVQLALIDEQIRKQRELRDSTSRLGQIVRDFSRTSIFERLFGKASPESIDKAVKFANQITLMFAGISKGGRRVIAGLGAILGGKTKKGFEEIKNGIAGIALEFVKLSEMLFGFNFTDKFKEGLEKGDLKAIGDELFRTVGGVLFKGALKFGGFFGNALFEGIKLVLFKLPELLFRLAGQSAIADAFASIFSPLENLSFTDIISGIANTITSALDGVRAFINSPEGKAIAEYFEITLQTAISSFVALLNSEEFSGATDALGRLIDAVVRFGTTFAGLVALGLFALRIQSLTASFALARPLLEAITPLLNDLVGDFDKATKDLAAITERDDFEQILLGLAALSAVIGLIVFGPAILAGLGVFVLGLIFLKVVLQSLEGVLYVLAGIGLIIEGLSTGDGEKAGQGLIKVAAGLTDIAAAIAGVTFEVLADIAEGILTILGVDYDEDKIQNIRDLGTALQDLNAADLALRAEEGAGGFSSFFENLPVIIDALGLKFRLFFANLKLDVANFVRDTLISLNELGSSIGLDKLKEATGIDLNISEDAGAGLVENAEAEVARVQQDIDALFADLSTKGLISGNLSVTDFAIEIDSLDPSVKDDVIAKLNEVLADPNISEEQKIKLTSSLISIDTESFGNLGANFSTLADSFNEDLEDPYIQDAINNAIFNIIKNSIDTGEFTPEQITELASTYGLNSSLLSDIMSAILANPDAVENPEGEFSTFESLGINVVNGIVTGTNSQESVDALNQAGADMIGEVEAGVTSAAEIQSPSQLAVRWGQALVDGLKIGVMNLLPVVDFIKAQFFVLDTQVKSTAYSIQTRFGTAANSMIFSSSVIMIAVNQMILAFRNLGSVAANAAIMIGQAGFAAQQAMGVTPNSNVQPATAGAPVNPFNIEGFKNGGNIMRGQLAETNEGGISELFRTPSGRTLFLPGQSGMIEPIRGGSMMGGSTTQFIGDTYHISVIGGSDLTEAQVESLFKKAMREENFRNQTNKQLERKGKV